MGDGRSAPALGTLLASVALAGPVALAADPAKDDRVVCVPAQDSRSWVCGTPDNPPEVRPPAPKVAAPAAPASSLAPPPFLIDPNRRAGYPIPSPAVAPRAATREPSPDMPTPNRRVSAPSQGTDSSAASPTPERAASEGAPSHSQPASASRSEPAAASRSAAPPLNPDAVSKREGEQAADADEASTSAATEPERALPVAPAAKTSGKPDDAPAQDDLEPAPVGTAEPVEPAQPSARATATSSPTEPVAPARPAASLSSPPPPASGKTVPAPSAVAAPEPETRANAETAAPAPAAAGAHEPEPERAPATKSSADTGATAASDHDSTAPQSPPGGPAPAKPAPVSHADPGGFRDAAAFLALKPERYTVQLGRAERRESLETLAAELGLPRDELYAVAWRSGGQHGWLLLWGEFADEGAAQAALAGLRGHERLVGAWPRRIRAMQDESRPSGARERQP